MFTHVPESDAFRAGVKDPMQISFEIIDTDLWSWVIPFSNEVTSLGFVGHERHFAQLNGNVDSAAAFTAMLARQRGFGDRFAQPSYLFPPHVIREYAHYNASLHGPNYVLTGNCAGFLDPVFSSGVAFATESGLRAAKLLQQQLQGRAVDWESEYADHIKQGAAVFRSYIEAWYSGDLHTIFFAPRLQQDIKEKIVSVLAGYVWDPNNSFVTQHDRALRALAQVIKLEARSPA
jgi:flavin-dependent dehydrogenase